MSPSTQQAVTERTLAEERALDHLEAWADRAIGEFCVSRREEENATAELAEALKVLRAALTERDALAADVDRVRTYAVRVDQAQKSLGPMMVPVHVLMAEVLRRIETR